MQFVSHACAVKPPALHRCAVVLAMIGLSLVSAAGQGVPVGLQEGTATFTQSHPTLNYSPDECYNGAGMTPVGSGEGWAIGRPNVNGIPNAAQEEIAVWETTTNITATSISFTMCHQTTTDCTHLIGCFRWSVTTDDRSTFADGLDNNGDVNANWTVLTNPSVTLPSGMSYSIRPQDGSILICSNMSTPPCSVPCIGNYVVSFAIPTNLTQSGITGIRLEVFEDPSLPGGGPGLHAPQNSGNFALTELVVTHTPTPPNPLRSLSVTAGSGYLAVQNSPALMPTTGLTVEAWVKWDGPISGNGANTIVRKGPVHPNTAYNLRIDGGATNRLYWYVGTGTGSSFVTAYTSTAFPIGVWTHVAGTYDGSYARLFVNGALVSTAAGSGPLRPSGELRIGKGENYYPEYWSGLIDEVRIWPFARTAAEISGGGANTYTLGNFPGLVAAWNLNGNLNDASGVHNGAAVGAPAFSTDCGACNGPFAANRAFPYGLSSAISCPLSPIAGLSSVPDASLGNPGFAVVCAAAPTNSPGICALSFGSVPTPLSAFGVDIWIDVVSPAYAGAVSVYADNNGLCRIPAPLYGPTPQLVGLQIYAQFFWFSSCSPLGLVGSNATAATF